MEDDESTAATYRPLNDDVDSEDDEDVEASAFDEAADQELIQQEKRKMLKSKGIKINKPRAETDKKKAQKSQEEEDEE